MVLSHKIKRHIEGLEIARNRKRWHYRGNRAGRKVQERRRKHLQSIFFSRPSAYRHEIVKKDSPISFGFLNIRSLHNKVEDVFEIMKMKKIDGLFLAEAWHDLESVCISLLRQEGMKVHEQERQGKPDKINKLSTNHGRVAAVINAGFELLQLHVAKQSIYFKHI